METAPKKETELSTVIPSLPSALITLCCPGTKTPELLFKTVIIISHLTGSMDQKAAWWVTPECPREVSVSLIVLSLHECMSGSRASTWA